jgi:hypothetical protein
MNNISMIDSYVVLTEIQRDHLLVEEPAVRPTIPEDPFKKQRSFGVPSEKMKCTRQLLVVDSVEPMTDRENTSSSNACQ